MTDKSQEVSEDISRLLIDAYTAIGMAVAALDIIATGKVSATETAHAALKMIQIRYPEIAKMRPIDRKDAN